MWVVVVRLSFFVFAFSFFGRRTATSSVSSRCVCYVRFELRYVRSSKELKKTLNAIGIIHLHTIYARLFQTICIFGFDDIHTEFGWVRCRWAWARGTHGEAEYASLFVTFNLDKTLLRDVVHGRRTCTHTAAAATDKGGPDVNLLSLLFNFCWFINKKPLNTLPSDWGRTHTHTRARSLDAVR